MKIEIKKVTNYQCVYTITRKDNSIENITLKTKTYLVHDICHFVVEKQLGYKKGFWGMLSQGHSFNELFGKDNPQTGELRFIEQIVGPVQSLYSGNIPKEDFNQYIQHLDFKLQSDVLEDCLTEIELIITKWEQLIVGHKINLEWI